MTAVAAHTDEVLPKSLGLHIVEGVPCFLVCYLSLQEWLSCPIPQPFNFTERKPRLMKVKISLPMTTPKAGEPRLRALGASVHVWVAGDHVGPAATRPELKAGDATPTSVTLGATCVPAPFQHG